MCDPGGIGLGPRGAGEASGFEAGYRHFQAVLLHAARGRQPVLLVKPELVMGRTIPQIDYTWSARPIGYAKDFGGGVSLLSF